MRLVQHSQWRSVRSIPSFLVSLLLFSPARGQDVDVLDPLPVLQTRQEPVSIDSGEVQNTGSEPAVVFETIIEVPETSWIRLLFEQVVLSGRGREASFLRITALADPVLEELPVQELNAARLQQWRNTSAYFNGNSVSLELVAFPNTGVNRVVLTSVLAESREIIGFGGSICGANDDRVLSNDARVARVLPVGCTAWLISDTEHCFLSAGHCGLPCSGGGCNLGSPAACIQICEFNVPLSNATTGTIVNPSPNDQFPVDAASIQITCVGTGNDWSYFGCFTNALGQTPFQRQNAAFNLAAAAPAVGNPAQTITIAGHGTDNTPNQNNQVQQTHSGPYTQLTGTTVQYQVDTTGGNSGSAVLDTTTNLAIGIHTNAGCTSTGGANQGTAMQNAGLQAALAAPIGACTNQPPACDPGGPYAAACQGLITMLQLDGSGSSDPDGDTLTFSWTSSCPGAAFSDPSSAMPVLSVDTSCACAIACMVTLTVGDGTASASCDASVSITACHPPDCSQAALSSTSCWPPNHKFIPVEVLGITDADGDPVTITITGISQDEPVKMKGTGSGMTCPDGVKVDMDGDGNAEAAGLRCERDGTGDGRVYTVKFTASDGKGFSCNGSASFCVPHDRDPGTSCNDNGQLFDSTICPAGSGAAAQAESRDIYTLEEMSSLTPEPLYIRGHVHWDDELDISEAITILSNLFMRSEPFDCPDAADVNDSGEVDISDPIYLLGYLFLGGPAPLAPFPELGSDPTADLLDCD